jgi:RNA polymerase sigma-70 factor (ECF subfamily)
MRRMRLMRAHAREVSIERLPAAPSTIGAADVEAEVLSLFDRFRDPLLRYVCAFGIPAAEGEDLIQEVFLALFRHLRRDGPRSNLQGWLFRVAHNLALKRRARHGRERARFGSYIRPVMALIDPADDPEVRLLNHQRRTRLRRVFDALPERDRQCLHLRRTGLRYREIARVLDISLGAVAKSLARAIARLERADAG